MHQTWASRAAMLWAVYALCGSLSLCAGPAEQFQKNVRPILQNHCFECHGPEKHKGNLNLAAVTNYTQVTAAPESWQLVLERIQAYEMPPPGKGELDFDQHKVLVDWLHELPRAEQSDCDQVASDRNTTSYRGYVMSRRLNRDEYNNTVRDLIGVDLHLEDLLPADGGGGEGFDTTGSALFTSSLHVEKYLAAASRIVESILPDDEANLAPELRRARYGVLITQPTACTPARQAAEKVLESFAHRAFRRPVTPAEIGRLLQLFDRGWTRGDGYVGSLRLAIKGVLISPHFLFLTEPESSVGGVQPLAPVPLATRLSYLLWSSMPDEELMALAENGDLEDERVYVSQVQRMLADPKADALGERFAAQWLEIERLGTEVRPDTKKFPQFDDQLCRSMRREVTTYFNYIMRHDRSLIDLIDSDYTFVDQRLAQLYDLPQPATGQFARTTLDDHTRGGVLGMAAIHALTAYPTRTSPVLRGRWVLEALLGEKVPPPPPDVPALADPSSQPTPVTLRAQLEAHRAKAECAGCHSKMDPLGFGLENFDVLGRWRQSDRGLPIDAEGTLPSGEKFTGPIGLKKVLLERRRDVIKHLVRKLDGFALGRELNRFDNCTVDRTVEALEQNDYRGSILIEQIATSFPFRHRYYPNPDPNL